MSLATGVGSMPGDDQHAFELAVGIALDLPDLPFLPEVPGRGAAATMTGRGLGVVAELGADLQPAGWRLTGQSASGIDQRRARSLLAQDLDLLEERAQGLTGSFKIQVCGPWALASTVERPRGGAVLGDHGARRELAQALGEGLGEHVRDVRRRVPGATRVVVQLDEPTLPAVLAGRVPTASGLHTLRSIDLPEVSDLLAGVLEVVVAAGGEPWVHSCAARTPLDLLRGAGARGLSVDLDQLAAEDHELLAEALDAGESVVLGVVPGRDPAHQPGDKELVVRVERWLDLVGLDLETVGPRLGLSPSCGLAGASGAWSREALRLLTSAARSLTP